MKRQKHEKQAELDAIRDEVRKAYEADVSADKLKQVEAMRRKRCTDLERSLRGKRPKPEPQPTLPGVDVRRQERL